VRKCIAFYPGGKNRPRWLPCPGGAAHNSALCRAHADALSGIVHGLGVLLAPGLAPSLGEVGAQSGEEFAPQQNPDDPPQRRAVPDPRITRRITRPAKNLIQ
jgi:hypothetical protein